MILTLMRVFGEDTVATMLEAAKKVPRTEAIATNLQKDRLNAWLRIEKSVDDVFMHLRLSTAADLTDPRFSVLSKYADFVKAKTGKSNDSVKTSILLQMVAAWNNPSKSSAEREALKKQYLSWRSDYHWDFL
ncbi:unnamed protein product [Phytophthora lilii]|uniref:Unnamed protein product n=1 Tax=Phytophthora lilii TaxID=2077276 RepID=A0A9W6U2F1_9STRA|nr:unnamed protein product [Phytophthora lilii]